MGPFVANQLLFALSTALVRQIYPGVTGVDMLSMRCSVAFSFLKETNSRDLPVLRHANLRLRTTDYRAYLLRLCDDPTNCTTVWEQPYVVRSDPKRSVARYVGHGTIRLSALLRHFHVVPQPHQCHLYQNVGGSTSAPAIAGDSRNVE